MAAASPSQSPGHPLRVLAVDDNSLNLAVLTRLLSKKFSHMLDGPPVAVDSGLKALQLLQDHVFDVIFMDIQMPFISGVDCTERIRIGADGVLHANKSARIVAVTTAVGDEPEILYRRKGFDGLIGKPVAFDAVRQLLQPLSLAAKLALEECTAHLPMVDVRGHKVYAPLPPLKELPERERLFYTYGDRAVIALRNAPEITRTSQFETLLRQQTLDSLRQFGPSAMALTEHSPYGVSDRRRLRQYDSPSFEAAWSPACIDEAETKSHLPQSHDLSETTALSCDAEVEAPSTNPSRRHSRLRSERQGSLTISQSALHAQLQREMEAASLTVPARRMGRLAHQRASMSALPAPQGPLVATEHDDEPLSPTDDWSTYLDAQGKCHHTQRAGLLALCSLHRGSFAETFSVPRGSEDVSSSESAGLSSFRSDSISTDGGDAMSSLVTTPEQELSQDDTMLCGDSDTKQTSYAEDISAEPFNDTLLEGTPLSKTGRTRPALARHNATTHVARVPTGDLCHAMDQLDVT